MKRMLMVATVARHFVCFHQPCINWLKSQGVQVDVASKGEEPVLCADHNLSFSLCRSPFDKNNIKAYKELSRILEEGSYDIIHCHTPIGGMLTRLAARKYRKKGVRVLYTAHGFHFFRGAPLLNWIIYYPIERFLSRFTDCLITINEEDYQFAQKHLKAKNTVHVHGVGCDTERYSVLSAEEKAARKQAAGYDPDAPLLVYVAELNLNKNQNMLLHAMVDILKEYPNAKLLLAGPDNFDGAYQRLAENLGVSQQVEFLGMRDDIPELLAMCDVGVASSLREGLPVNIMECMASGLPVVAGDNRGHRALIAQGETGFLVEPDDAKTMAEQVLAILGDAALYAKLSQNAVARVQSYSKETVLQELSEIYAPYIS